MTDIVKEGFRRAEESLKEEEIQRIKNVVKATLEKLSLKEKQKKELEDEIKILKKDIDNLRDGRIDLIKERQDVDAKAKEVSLIIIKERIVEKQVPMWFYPWIIEVKPFLYPSYFASGITTSGNTATCDVFTGTSANCFETTNSTAKLSVSGTYQLSDGTIKYL